MKYRATISLEFEAFDTLVLRDRKQAMLVWMKEFEQAFGPATLVIKNRRPRRTPRAPAPAEVWPGE